MADYQHPKRAIVSVWHKEVGGGGTFLGSGVFISPRHVLTAKHVIDQQGYRDELCLGLVQDYHSVPVKTRHTHPELDIALIDLEKEFSDQGLAWADWNSNDLKGEKVDFYGINRFNHARDENKDHTVGTWHPELGVYLCDHRVLKGFSGGAAVVNGRMVGVIVERHESEQVTLFIPLCLAADWFNRIVSAEDRGRYFSVQPVPAKTHRHEIQGAFAQHIRQEIAGLLGRPKLRSLADALRETAPKEAATVLPESLLVPKQDHCNIDSAISTLRVATKACLQKLTGNGSSAAPEIVQGATDVLGWLVLLAVSETWLQSDAGLSERLLSAEQIQIPVATEAGIEVVIARLHAWQARLKLVGDTKVRGVTQVDWDELELGFTKKDALTEIKRLIWKTVHGDEAPHPFGKVDEDDLKMTLKDRYEQDKQHYYIVIPAERYDRIASAGQLLTELRRDLEYLGAFLIGSKTGDQILVIAEGGLRAKIREFLLMVKDYL